MQNCIVLDVTNVSGEKHAFFHTSGRLSCAGVNAIVGKYLVAPSVLCCNSTTSSRTQYKPVSDTILLDQYAKGLFISIPIHVSCHLLEWLLSSLPLGIVSIYMWVQSKSHWCSNIPCVLVCLDKWPLMQMCP